MSDRSLTSPDSALAGDPVRPSLGTTRHVRFGALVIAAIFLGFGAWAAVAPLASGVIAHGQVTVDSQRKLIQAPETGIVRRIHIRDGDNVAAGDVLVTLDRTQPAAEYAIVQSAYDQAVAEEARLNAELNNLSDVKKPASFVGRPETDEIFDGQVDLFRKRVDARTGEREILLQRNGQLQGLTTGLNSQIAGKKDQLRILDQELEGLEQLLQEGLTTRQRVFALKREKARLEGEIGEHVADLSRAETARGETDLQILQVERTQLEESSTALSDVRTRLINFGERLAAVRQTLDQTEIRAPIEGVVVGLNIHTEGGVVGKGETVLEIVPTKDRLIVEAKVRPQDIDVVAVGQQADIRFTAFNQRTTPVLKGRLDYLSADSLVDPATNQRYFLARVSVVEAEPPFKDLSISPGMPAEVIIKSGELTPLAYLLRPLTNSFARAWREN